MKDPSRAIVLGELKLRSELDALKKRGDRGYRKASDGHCIIIEEGGSISISHNNNINLTEINH